MVNKTMLLKKYGYHLAASGLGDMNGLELYLSWQNEQANAALRHLTLEDADAAIATAYDELWAFQAKMSKKSKGWEALKNGS